MTDTEYVRFLRARITELRLVKNVSEHKMSLELGKSGSYIRSITNGGSLPSVRELFNIFEYLGVTPSEFFAPIDNSGSPRGRLYDRISRLSDEDIEKLDVIVGWLESR